MNKKIIFSLCFIFTLLLNGLVSNWALAFNAPSNTLEKQEITYVAFGDSIAEGYAINLKTRAESEALITGADESYAFTTGSYTDLIRQELAEDYDVTSYNFAYSGDTCQDLIDYINEFYDQQNNSAKNTNSNATYPSLTNNQIYESVSNANIITICIGANNILSKASSLISGFLGFNESKTQTVTKVQMEETCKDYILGNESKNIKGFKSEFEQLLTILNKLNPNAKIYFTNVYNPYKVLDLNSSVLALAQYSFPLLTQANLNTISQVTETVIGGGKDSQNQDYMGLNNIIENGIREFNQTNSKNNFTFVNSKQQFDNKFNNTSTETRKSYNDYLNPCLDQISLSSLGAISSNPNSIYTQYLDPHPTIQGHQLLFDAHQAIGLNAYLDYTISFVTNCDIRINNQIVSANSKIKKPAISRDSYFLTGWYTDSSMTEEWDFNNNVQSDMTLYAKWEKQQPKSHTATILILSGTIVVTLAISGIIAICNYRKRVF